MLKRTLFCAIIAFTTFTCCAQQKATLNHIGIVVTDVKKSMAFYQQWFHLDSIKCPFTGNIRWLSLGGSMQLHLIGAEKSEVLPSKENHIAFSVASVADYITLLDKSGITYSDGNGHFGKFATRPDGVHQIYFPDPDGYQLEVNDAR
jgi:lactoylglutathione lyase